MPDIAMCSGKECPVRLHCYRHTAIPLERQSYFVNPPIKVENGKLKCEYFWGGEEMFDQLIHDLQIENNEKNN